MDAVWRYVERCGIEFDIAVNVFTGGNLGQTVSYRSAVAERNGKRWGCIMCRFLNWAVERDHCAKQFLGGPTLKLTFIRAGVAFAVAGLLIAEGTHEAVHLVSTLF